MIIIEEENVKAAGVVSAAFAVYGGGRKKMKKFEEI